MERTPRPKRLQETPPPPGFWQRVWAIMHRGDSAGWLLCTSLQALLALGFIGLAKLCEGYPWEPQAKTLVIVAILITWCMALRTIRVRLVELVILAHKASRAILSDVADSGLERLKASLRGHQVSYARQSMLYLRIIAAGITIPFFVLPLFAAGVSVALFYLQGAVDGGFISLALVSAAMALVVGTYFHWSILPQPAVARVRKPISTRMRDREAA